MADEAEKKKSIIKQLKKSLSSATVGRNKGGSIDKGTIRPNSFIQDDTYQIIHVKVVMIGDAGIGKTALVTQFLEKRFLEGYRETIERYVKHSETVNGSEAQIDIWDIGGSPDNRLNQEKGHIIGNQFMLVYSITDRMSFENIDKYYRAIAERKRIHNLHAVIVGTRYDMEEQREVSTEEGIQLAQRLRTGFFEVSSLTGYNVEDAFHFLCLPQQKMFVAMKSDWVREKRRSSTGGSGSSPSHSPTSPRSKEGTPVKEPTATPEESPSRPQTSFPSLEVERPTQEKILEVKATIVAFQDALLRLSEKKMRLLTSGELSQIEEIIQDMKKAASDKQLLEDILVKMEASAPSELSSPRELSPQTSPASSNTPEPSQSPTPITPLKARRSLPVPTKPPPPVPFESSSKLLVQILKMRKTLEYEAKNSKILKSNGELEEYERTLELLKRMEIQIWKKEQQLKGMLKRELPLSEYSEDQIEATLKIQQFFLSCIYKKRYQERLTQHKKRTNIVNEIFSTEVHYVSSMKEILELYLKPFRCMIMENAPILSQEDIRIIFSDIEVILNANLKLLSELDKRLAVWHPSTCIGDVFLEMTPVFAVYTMYINNFSLSVQRLKQFHENSQYIAFLEGNELSPDHLETLLIKPVQRIPRYVLLVEDLLNNTWKDHRDYDTLKVAFEKITEMANSINEKKREAENIRKVYQIEGTLCGKFSTILDAQRRFVREGPISVIEGKNSKVRFVFLFNDIMLVTKPLSKDKAKPKYEVKRNIALFGLNVIDCQDSSNVKNAFEIASASHVILFSFESPFAKQQWMNDLQTSIITTSSRIRRVEEQSWKQNRSKSIQAKELIARRYTNHKKMDTLKKNESGRASSPVPVARPVSPPTLPARWSRAPAQSFPDPFIPSIVSPQHSPRRDDSPRTQESPRSPRQQQEIFYRPIVFSSMPPEMLPKKRGSIGGHRNENK